MNKIERLVAALAFATFVVLMFGCAEELDDEPSVEEIIAQGKKYLTLGEAVEAADAFNAALRRDPVNKDAKFGIILANTLQFTNLISELVDLVGDFLSVGPMEPVDLEGGWIEPLADDEPLGDLIQDFFRQVIEPKFVQSETMYIELSQTPGFSFDLERYTVVLMDSTLIDFSGVFDDAELHFFGTINSLLLAVTNFILAHDINFDLDSLVLPEFGDDILETVDGILDLLKGLLTDPNYPNFLYMKEDGVPRMQATGIHLGLTFLRLNMMIDAVVADTGDQSDNPIRFIDQNGNGMWDQDEAIEISGLFTIEPALIPIVHNLAGDLAVALFDITPLDIDPFERNPFYPASLNDILVYLIDGLDNPIIPPDFLPIDIGPFFYAPAPDGVRGLLIFVIDIWDLVSGFL